MTAAYKTPRMGRLNLPKTLDWKMTNWIFDALETE